MSQLGLEVMHTHLIQLGVLCAADGELEAEVRRFAACMVSVLRTKRFVTAEVTHEGSGC
jgi:hypothetical protein